MQMQSSETLEAASKEISPAVDAGFDYVKFPELSIDDQVESLPEAMYAEIELGDMQKV
jgi:hypothetical protein